MSERRPIVVRAIAVVVDDDKVLLVPSKVSPDGWVPPGGKVKRHERAHDAAAREVLEEAGWCIDVAGLVAYREAWWDDRDSLELYFAARPAKSGQGVQAEEPERKGEWVPVSKLGERRYFPEELAALCGLAESAPGPVRYLGAADLRGNAQNG